MKRSRLCRSVIHSLESCLGAAAVFLTLCAQAQPQAALVKPHAGMLRFPAISGRQIVFVYANKLWLVPKEGGSAVPLASPPGRLMLPKFSPDGTTVAFTGNYDGNPDLYTLPVDGGVPVRVTHNPGADILCNWTPDGKLLFSSNFAAGIARTQQLYTVPTKGGLPAKLPVPYGRDAAISPDGKLLAYTPDSTNFRTWKRYRGGWAQDIWLFDLQKKTSKRITDWEGTDTLPMWHGTTIYYLSDGGPEHRLNIWRYDTLTSKRRQETHYADYDVKWPSIGPGTNGGGEIVFEHGSELDVLDLAAAKTRSVEVRVPGDRGDLRARLVDVTKYIADWSISPNGKRAAVEARGDIWTVPAKNGSPRNLTHSAGSAERSPAWSPDGRWIAYFSDASGEYQLYITPSDGKGEARQLTHDGKTFRMNAGWSPDSKTITFNDKSGAIYLTNVATSKTTLIDTDPRGRQRGVSWSADSKWLAYARSQPSNTDASTIWIYSADTGKSRQVTSGMFNDSSPVFDHKGDYLYFSSNRSFSAPQYDDFGATWIYSATEVLLAAPLRGDIRSPLLPTSDEEAVTAVKSTMARTNYAPNNLVETGIVPAELVSPAADDEVSGEWKGTAGPVKFTLTLILGAGNKLTGTIDSDQGSGSVTGTYNPGSKELSLTIAITGGPMVTLTGKIAGSTLTGTATAAGMVFDVNATRKAPPASAAPVKGATPSAAGAAAPAKAVSVSIDFDGFEQRVILLPVKSGRFGSLAVNDRNQLIFARMAAPGTEADQGIKLFDLADEARSEKVVVAGASNFDITADGKKLLVARGQSATIQDASAGATGEPVVTTGMATMIEPRVEWRQIFDDAWRIERDYFYDPNMHHVDWQAVHNQYAKMLDDCVTRDDLSYVIGEMISELNVGHAYYGGGDVAPEPTTNIGLLGADFTLENGAFRISRIISGAPWDVDARGPLTQPGVKVKKGDYVLAVNGTPLDASQDPWAAFQGMANRTATLTVSSKPTIDSTAVDATVNLIGSENHLRYRAWIERNRAYVDQKTGGRVGYIYVPDTGTDGQDDLVRQFMGQTGKEALIIDERWNSGGQIPDRFIELLNRPVTNYWAVRDGRDWVWPPVSHQGPKCMLINGEAGSGGDAFPWYFREMKLGKLIGTRTWGGLVGISGNPGLIDGGGVTAPTFGFYKKNGTWGIEGNGVDPDIEVIDDPALMTDGGDPQLDTAIKEMEAELKRNPYTAPHRPAYPDKRGIGINPKDK